MAKVIVRRQRQPGCALQNSFKGNACLSASKCGTDTVMDAITKGQMGFGLYPVQPNGAGTLVELIVILLIVHLLKEAQQLNDENKGFV